VSYRCGIEPSLARLMDVAPGGPRVTCDACGLCMIIREDRLPPAWIRNGKAPPGWKMTKDADGKRTDLCKTCKVKP
jgi:hypothetical protein